MRRLVLLAAVVTCAAIAQQQADPAFPTKVERPAYTRNHPTIVIDEAHSNFHTADGRYKPLAEMLRSDGYRVERGTKKFEPGSLRGARVLVISNARAANATQDDSAAAFTDAECDVVRDWVRGGGSLLLIADHTPFGGAAANLAQRFGVGLGKGFVIDSVNSNPEDRSALIFSRDNKLLGDHVIVRGRSGQERISSVTAFTGESLSVPAGATALLQLGGTAYEALTRKDAEALMEAVKKGTPPPSSVRAVAGRAMGLAMPFGKGRLAVFGEAAMFSAQLLHFEVDGKMQEFKMGMNFPGNDDRQFALNLFHWLSGALQ